MAKTKGPLFSVDAHGSLAKNLTYSHRKSGQQVRRYNKPLKPASAKQRGQRRLTEFLVAQWQDMSDAAKAIWETNAKKSGLNLPGYHYFLREAQRDLYLHHGLAGYWHCNEIVGGKVLDLSGNALHGTLKPDYPANAPVLVDSYKTKFGKGLLYDGVDEYFILPLSDLLKITGSFFAETWIKPTGGHVANGTHHTIIDAISQSASWLRFHTNGQLQFYLTTDVTGYELYSIKDTWGEQFYCLSVVFDQPAEEMHIYIDGDLDRTLTPVTGNVQTGVVPTTISSIINYFNGIIDEVCLYNRALSATEIKTRYRFATREVS